MLAEMRPTELNNWIALMRVEPWGAFRDDLRVGFAAASIAPAFAKKADGGGFSPAEFMPQFAREPEPERPVGNPTLRAFLNGMSKD